jgi:hypothetical protein
VRVGARLDPASTPAYRGGVTEPGTDARRKGLLCARQRQATPLERWSAVTHTQPSVVSYRVLGARVETNNEGPDAHFVDVELHYSDNTTRKIALLMTDESSGWKVCTARGY